MLISGKIERKVQVKQRFIYKIKQYNIVIVFCCCDKMQKKEIQGDDGFSSDSDTLQEQELEPNELMRDNEDNHYKQVIKWKLPSPQKIREKSYSLDPDIATGWTSRVELPKPIPILNTNQYIDKIVTKALRQSAQRLKVVYLGARFPTSYEAWYGKTFINPYTHISAPACLKLTNRPFCGSMPDSDSCLLFDSNIESGNLDAAIRIAPNQYELFLRVDSNTQGHIQWFNFVIKGMRKGQKYTFHICNFQKHNSLYLRGARPYVLSLSKQQYYGVGWEQGGEVLKYERKLCKSASLLNVEVNAMFRLTFQYQPEFQNDTVQFAYSIPYMYSSLERFLQRLVQSEKRSYLKITKLCSSLGGLDVPLLFIHEDIDEISFDETERKTDKKCIIISGRAHPGESNGSYMMEGFISFLCGNSKIAKILRHNIIFKIVPMLNPDGVALGNYRTGLSGKDFNRQFRNPDPKIFPEVFSMKKLVSKNKQIFGNNLLMFLDFHGHSVKKNVFMYGPQFSISDQYYYKCRIFPKILGECTKMFRYYSCMFKVSEFKVTTARAIVLRKLGIPFSYTIEASNGSHYDHQKLKDIPFNEGSWSLMGEKIAEAINRYNEVIEQATKAKKKKQQKEGKKKKKKISIPQITNIRKYHSELKKVNNKSNKKIKEQSVIQFTKNAQFMQQSQNVKQIFKQIDKLENLKQEENKNCSQGNLSQGSSDIEGEGDDLDQDKLNFFYDLIKKKTKGFTYNQTDIQKFLSQKIPIIPEEPPQTQQSWSKRVHFQVVKKERSQKQVSEKKVQETRLYSQNLQNKKNYLFSRDQSQISEFNDVNMRVQAQRRVSFGTSIIDDLQKSGTEKIRNNVTHVDFFKHQRQSRKKIEDILFSNQIQRNAPHHKKDFKISQKNKSFSIGRDYL